MEKIQWGIIGCGNVTEMKSGPAFNKVENSSLVAVMRRNADKAKDYALRHQVPNWYDDAKKLINDVNVNAIYIATPPSSHEQYTIEAIAAGKPVYVEKPMTINAASAQRMMKVANDNSVKLSIAHYRRAQPYFNKIKELIKENTIGKIRVVQLEFSKKLLLKEELALPGNSWRVDPVMSGGGLFHDLAPHQLDLMYYFFGPVETANGVSVNQSELYKADDVVAGNILFKSGIVFQGLWHFNCSEAGEKDVCKITGSEGEISFGFFAEQKIMIKKSGETQSISFTPPRHVQQPMIEKVVQYFLGKGPNPCGAKDGVEVMQLLDAFTSCE